MRRTGRTFASRLCYGRIFHRGKSVDVLCNDDGRHTVLFVAFHSRDRTAYSVTVNGVVGYVLFAGRGEIRFDVAGKNGRNFDVERRDFGAEYRAERRHRGFCCGVESLKRNGKFCGNRTHVDDYAAASCAHNGQNSLNYVESSEKLSSKILCAAAESVSSIDPDMPIPALFTKTSILPYFPQPDRLRG